MLIPLYFIISATGGMVPARKSAALKFIVYMVAGSALMVAAILFVLYFTSGTSVVQYRGPWQNPPAPRALPRLSCVRDLHVGIRREDSVIPLPRLVARRLLPSTHLADDILLSSLLSKAGIYGFLRVAMEVLS